jgi:hypothetical protein
MSFYRERDIVELAQRLRRKGYMLELNLNRGDHEPDRIVFAEPPPRELSLKETLCGHTITSPVLVIRKAE